MRRTKMFVGAAAVAVLTLMARGFAVSAQDQTQRIEVQAKRFSYDPADITVKKGEPVVLVLKSEDVAHGLRFRELNVDMRVAKGGTTEVRFNPTKTGTFVGHCAVFCGAKHGSMMLTLHVVN